MIPRCSFCLYTAPVTLYGVHSRTLPTRCCCFNQAQSKLDSMWGLCVCIHAKVISAKIAASCMFPQKAQMQLTHDFYQHTLSHICARWKKPLMFWKLFPVLFKIVFMMSCWTWTLSSYVCFGGNSWCRKIKGREPRPQNNNNKLWKTIPKMFMESYWRDTNRRFRWLKVMRWLMTLGYHRLFSLQEHQEHPNWGDTVRGYCCMYDIGEGTPLNILTENLQGTKTKISWFQEIL